MTTTFETAKIGDRVWSVNYGWGVIQCTSYASNYPIMVEFAACERCYTLKGTQLRQGDNQSLFWDEVVIDAPEKPLPDLEVDAKVIVWNEPLRKVNRHFSHFDKFGNMFVFCDGKTSFTTDVAPKSWGYWELAE